MDGLFELIRRLVLLVIFAGFCELLLPRGSFRGYTRLVVGLLVMAMVLQPFLEWRNVAWDWESLLGMGQWATFGGELKGSDWQQQQSKELVEEQLASQAKSFLEDEYPDYDVVVELDVSFDEQGNLRDFNGMEVTVRPPAQGIEPVKPVVIGQGEESEYIAGAPNLVNSLALFLGIPAAKLSIWIYTGGGDADGQY